jgi:hypothetical protein
MFRFVGEFIITGVKWEKNFSKHGVKCSKDRIK